MADSALQKKEVRDFLARPLLATLVTLHRSGSPQITYMWHELDGGDILMSTTSDRVKAKNIARDPKVALAIVDPEDAYRWVIVNGKATISREGAFELLDRLVDKYMDPAAAPARKEQSRKQPRIVLRITPDRVRTSKL